MTTSEAEVHKGISRWSETLSRAPRHQAMSELMRSTIDLSFDPESDRAIGSRESGVMVTPSDELSDRALHEGEGEELMRTLNPPSHSHSHSHSPSPSSSSTPLAGERPDLPAHRHLESRFSVERPIGEGSFGKIWSVVDNELQRSVAVKTFKGEREKATRAYEDETRLVGRLDHPAIPTVYDVGVSDDGHPFMVMKLLQGESLYEIITRLAAGDEDTHRRYSFIRRVELLIQLLRVLMKVHGDGVIHRDIKPENILVSPEGVLSLLDWGCAIELSAVSEESVPCGTPTFMPPEQILGRSLSPASDLFAFAGVAYELLSLYPPIPMDRPLAETLKLSLTHQPKAVDQIPHPTQGYVPSEFRQIIMKTLARDPKARPQSAHEILEALQGGLEGHIEIICPRTRIKAYTARFMRALNKNPYRAVPIFYMTLIGIATLLMALGALLGALLM